MITASPHPTHAALSIESFDARRRRRRATLLLAALGFGGVLLTVLAMVRTSVRSELFTIGAVILEIGAVIALVFRRNEQHFRGLLRLTEANRRFALARQRYAQGLFADAASEFRANAAAMQGLPTYQVVCLLHGALARMSAGDESGARAALEEIRATGWERAKSFPRWCESVRALAARIPEHAEQWSRMVGR